MAHIDYLKFFKAGQLGSIRQDDKINGFDKISFGMVFKLCWKFRADNSLSSLISAEQFNDFVLRTYKEMKATQDYVKTEIAQQVIK
jgi:hypothetical protein